MVRRRSRVAGHDVHLSVVVHLQLPVLRISAKLLQIISLLKFPRTKESVKRR